MHWFAGWVPDPGGHDVARVPTPAGAHSLWPGGGPQVWAVGDWEPWEARSIEAGDLQVVVFGACLATEIELAAAAAAIRRTGDYAALTRLPGNGVYVVGEAGQVTVVVDLAGLYPVFHTRWAGGMVFASSPLPIAELLGAGPDACWLAAQVFCPEIPEVSGTGSAFTRIARTRPGHVLTLSHHGAAEEPIPLRLGGTSLTDGAETLKAALVSAIERRATLGPAVTADLSGGLDSSSLAHLAARHLPAGLSAITYADAVSVNTDDLAYARRCAEADPRLHQVLIPGDDRCLPFTDLLAAPLLDEPTQDTLHATRTRARLAPAAQHRSIHLSGDGGDAVLTGPLTYLADLVRAGRVRDLIREASTWARLRNRPAHTLLRAALRLARSDYANAIHRAARQVRGGGVPAQRGVEDHLTWCAISRASAWATARARRELASRLDQAAETVGGLGWCSTGDGSALRDIQAGGASARTFNDLARIEGVTVHVPFLDNQVIAACTAVSVADRTTTRTPKPLLAAALGGLVPDFVLRRRTKGDYTAASYAGLQQAAPVLRDMLTDPILADLGLIEPGPARAALDDAIGGRAFPLAALGDVLAAEQWLRLLTNRPQPAFWTPTASARGTR